MLTGLFISGLSADMGGIVTPSDSEVLDRTRKRVGKRSGGWEKSNNRRRRNRESINLLGRNGTEFLNKYYIVTYEW